MRRFDPTRSLLAGMDTSVLQTRLNDLQRIYLDLSSGQKGESFSYTQGDGGKAVTYSKANLADLQQAIMLLQAQLGIVCKPRRAIGVRF